MDDLAMGDIVCVLVLEVRSRLSDRLVSFF